MKNKIEKDIQDKTYQFPSDFEAPESTKDIQQIFGAHGLINGRMITASKSSYRKQNPDNLVVFNANIIMRIGKVFYGDLDITKDYEILKEISKCLDTTLYVLWEMDARFGAEQQSIDALKNKAVWNTSIEEIPTLKWYLNRNE